jgi:hypothetical protein
VHLLLIGHTGRMTQMCMFCTCLNSCSLPSVSVVRNYLDVWSGFIFTTFDKHCLIMSHHCEHFIQSLFYGVKMASARSRNNFPAEEILARI